MTIKMARPKRAVKSKCTGIEQTKCLVNQCPSFLNRLLLSSDLPTTKSPMNLVVCINQAGTQPYRNIPNFNGCVNPQWTIRKRDSMEKNTLIDIAKSNRQFTSHT